MGLGTLASPLATGMAPVSTPVCASGHECIHATQVPTTGDRAGCADIAAFVGALDPSDSYWHFVIPASQGYLFTSSAASWFSATFSPSSSEVVATLVQPVFSGFPLPVIEGYRGIVLETDRTTLTWASIPDGGTTETTEAEGTGPEDSAMGGDFQLSSSCAGTATTTTTTAGSSTTSTTSRTSSTSSSTSSATSTAPGSTTSSHTTATSSAGSGVAGASTSTPSTGANVMFGVGLALLAGGAGLFFGGRRLLRRRSK